MESCSEAKQIVGIINSVNGDMEAIDHNTICVVGLEKFHGKKERDNCRKLLIRSVLIRQEMNRGLGLVDDPEGLCEISEMISSSFKEFALWQAAMHKFHAYGTLSAKASAKSRPNPAVHQQLLPNKRQRLSSGFNQSSSDPAQISCQQSPAQVNTEIRQIMTQYCSL